MGEFNNLNTNKCEETKPKPAWITGMTVEDAEIRLQNDIRQVKKSFLSIGLTLKHVRDNRLYLQDDTGDFKNVYEWAFAKFELKKPTVIRYIQICEQFPINLETIELEGKYKDFAYSHIVEMLPMNNELRQMIKSGMTVAQIKDIRKEYEKNTGVGKKTVSVQKRSEFSGSLSNPEDMDGISSIVDMVQTGLPVFASDEDIWEWLFAPEKWGDGLWYTDENIQAKYYKWDFENGCRLIAVKYRHSSSLKELDSPDGCLYQKEADGKFCDEPHFHFIYSDDYLRQSDLYTQEVDRYYSNDTVSAEFLIEFLRKMQEETEAYSEEDTYKGQIPGQMELSELMDMEIDEADGIIEAYNLEGSAVMREIWDVLNGEGMDADIVDEKVVELLDSASSKEKVKIMEALREISASA